jgi:hypothetical protein
MNKTRTEKKPYCSPSTGEPCSAAQYIAEIVCLRNFKRKKTGDPSFKFWNKEEKSIYQGQVVTANKLINEYGTEAVLSYINYNKNIYSLGHFNPIKFIKDGISKTKWILEKNKSTLPIIIEKEKQPEVVTEFEIPKPKTKQTLIDKLKRT